MIFCKFNRFRTISNRRTWIGCLLAARSAACVERRRGWSSSTSLPRTKSTQIRSELKKKSRFFKKIFFVKFQKFINIDFSQLTWDYFYSEEANSRLHEMMRLGKAKKSRKRPQTTPAWDEDEQENQSTQDKVVLWKFWKTSIILFII